GGNRTLGTYIVKRLLSVIPVLFIVSIVIFLIIHLTPGDPAAVMLGEEANQQQIDELRKTLGLDLPLHEQYLKWISGVLQGDLGHSIFMNESVTTSIIDHLRPTLSLAVFGMGIALLIAIPSGIAAARRRGTIVDQSVMGFSLLGMSI